MTHRGNSWQGKERHTPHDGLHAPKHRRRIKDLQLSGAQACLSSFVGSKRRNIETQRCKNDIGTKLLPYTSA